MQTKYACIKYVHSRVTLYHTCKIDIRWKRSIHNCVLCDSMQFKKIGAECNCVHYGICSAVSLPIPLPGATRKKKIQVRKIPVNVPARKAPVGLPIKTPVDHPVKSPVNNPVCLPVAVNSPNRTLIAVNNLNQSAVGINNPHHTAIGVNIQIKTPVKVQIKTPVMAPENTLVSLPMRSPINLPVRTSIDVQDSPQMDVSVRTPDNISVKTSDNNSVRPSDNVSLRTSDNALLIMSDNSSRIQDNVPVNIPVQVFPSIQSKCLPPEQSVQLVLNNNKEKDCGVQDRKDREKKAEKDSQQNIIITNSKIEKENKTNIRELPIPKQNANIPKFYFPTGKPMPSTNSDLILQRVAAEFSKLDDGKAHKDQMGAIAKACGLPTFWKCPLFRATAGEEKGFITFESFSSMWKKVCDGRHDTASRFIYLLAKPDVDYLLYGDFEPLIQDIIETHPGLTFLLEAPEFHSRYVNTVISRIYFCVNRSWSGKLTANELRKSNFLQTLERLEEDDDINQVTDYFSYEHFYVIYCKFWELDKDHDLYIDMKDLYRHNDHALSLRVIDRIFSGAVSRGSTFQEGKMSYMEFVWFLIAEEDKRHPTSIEYWFRCMDLDGDGVISMYEMEQFYEEQMQKMEELGIEKLPFEDCLCQMLDLVRPEVKDRVTLKDLKKCKMADIFFDTFFNLDKFLDHEQRDPFANIRDPETDGPEPSAWEKYAAEEYEILVVEEGANEHDLDEINYEDDFEVDDDDNEYFDQGLIHVDDADNSKTNPRGKSSTTDDIYDFSTKNLGY